MLSHAGMLPPHNLEFCQQHPQLLRYITSLSGLFILLSTLVTNDKYWDMVIIFLTEVTQMMNYLRITRERTHPVPVPAPSLPSIIVGA
jgi:hypothetical protein